LILDLPSIDAKTQRACEIVVRDLSAHLQVLCAREVETLLRQTRAAAEKKMATEGEVNTPDLVEKLGLLTITEQEARR